MLCVQLINELACHSQLAESQREGQGAVSNDPQRLILVFASCLRSFSCGQWPAARKHRTRCCCTSGAAQTAATDTNGTLATTNASGTLAITDKGLQAQRPATLRKAAFAAVRRADELARGAWASGGVGSRM